MAKCAQLMPLVVDDEVMMRRLLHRALSQDGFACNLANDGNEALQMLAASKYDAVVTDLRMPNQHGHALATHLLAAQRRPVVIIHTGVMEPKLAKDLIVRGVDDILFKPTDFSVLAAKVKALVKRRSAMFREYVMPEAAEPRSTANDSTTTESTNAEDELSSTSQAEMPEVSVPLRSSEARPVDAREFGRGWSLLQRVFSWVSA
ncbi:Response regulator MprA [Anatilimnocola aggregata]|uniref:Response regulator MprA n=2 Tax=Anatilimnocola aggregata TaxID=2528021 RepID=A0A517Y4Z5_9BACT|nr:Response regulator MprA [Anatilimnocola aggregata]